MERPGRIESIALLFGLVLAASPARHGVGLLFDGALLGGVIYASAGLLVALTPVLVVRSLPRPRAVVHSGVHRLGAIVPWRDRN